ncbi:short chain dehydrogenase [Hoeflea sp. IMCC20628]|nr:short chain dehydrogenase [Hoeflea sp. IMCC20628]
MADIQSVMDKDKVAVVTGAASGIGLAAARIFAARGMCVVLVDNDRDRLAEAEKAVAAHSANPATDIVSIETDVSDLEAVEALERAVLERFGRVHLLMNNAGIQPGSSVFGPQANWDKVLSVNLVGIINGSRVFGPWRHCKRDRRAAW